MVEREPAMNTGGKLPQDPFTYMFVTRDARVHYLPTYGHTLQSMRECARLQRRRETTEPDSEQQRAPIPGSKRLGITGPWVRELHPILIQNA